MYGGIYDWHTEGPSRQHAAATTALQWRPLETRNYGVDYGVADSVGPYSDAERGGVAVVFWVPVTTILGPDRQTEYCLPCLGYQHGGGRCSWTD